MKGHSNVDGVKFAREVIVTNIRLWAETSEDGAAYDDIADRPQMFLFPFVPLSVVVNLYTVL